MDFTAAVRWLCEVQPQFWSWNDVKPTLLRPFETGYAVSVLNVILAPNGAAMQKHEMAIDTSSDLDDQQLELSAPPTTQVVRPTAVSRSPRCNTYIQFEYHIVFNSTYLVPQLLFLASRLDGTPLSLEELLPQLSMSCSNTQHVLDLSFDWRFVTQVEHPFLQIPFYTIHPCKTTSLMSLVLSSCDELEAPQKESAVTPDRYLVSWLSLYGQVVHLHLPFNLVYAKRLLACK